MKYSEDSVELKKTMVHVVVEIITYKPNAVVRKTIIKRPTGHIMVSSFDLGEELVEKIAPFDNYIQIIEGKANMMIDDKEFVLSLGEGIIIPAHSKLKFHANEQFKMVSTMIKSGYEGFWIELVDLIPMPDEIYLNQRSISIKRWAIGPNIRFLY